MILTNQTKDWPLDPKRDDLAQSWFKYLALQGEAVADAAEAAAHAGVDADKSVQQLVAELNRYVHQASFNASLAKHIRARRRQLGLPSPPALEATMDAAEAELAEHVAKVNSLYAFVCEVLADAGLYARE